MTKKEEGFDKVDWDFLDNIHASKGFGLKWRIWIKGCISSTNFSILINGRPHGKILETWGPKTRGSIISLPFHYDYGQL